MPPVRRYPGAAPHIAPSQVSNTTFNDGLTAGADTPSLISAFNGSSIFSNRYRDLGTHTPFERSSTTPPNVQSEISSLNDEAFHSARQPHVQSYNSSGSGEGEESSGEDEEHTERQEPREKPTESVQKGQEGGDDHELRDSAVKEDL